MNKNIILPEIVDITNINDLPNGTYWRIPVSVVEEVLSQTELDSFLLENGYKVKIGTIDYYLLNEDFQNSSLFDTLYDFNNEYFTNPFVWYYSTQSEH